MTDIITALYGSPSDNLRWMREFLNLRRSRPYMYDSPMLAEIKPLLLRFHPLDRNDIHEFLSHYNPEFALGGMEKHSFLAKYGRGIMSLALNKSWKPLSIKNSTPDAKNGLTYTAAIPLFEREDDYAWGNGNGL